MAASACRLVGHFCRQIISAFSDLKSAATNYPGGYWASLDGRIVVTVAFATHGWTQALGLQLLLIVIGAILAAAIGAQNAAFWWPALTNRDVECPDRQILLYSVTDCPANNTATMQV